MTQYKTWKALDEALSELEERVGLPDFIDLADEIGKALRNPPTPVAKSIDARKTRLSQARQDHRREIKSLDNKAADVAAHSAPEAKKEADEKRVALSDAVRMALIGRDIAKADAALDDLILDFPLDDNISALCEDVERAATSLQNDEDRKTARILRPVGELSAVASSEGAPRIVVSWTPESSGLAREYRIVRQDLLTTKVSLPFLCETSPFEDTDVVCGVPYKYTVVPCYHGIVVEDAAAESNIAIATAPIASMEVQGEGIGDCAVAHVSWSSPTYNEGVEFSLVLERIHDGLRKKINVTYCDGRYLDEDVIAGEAYRYELTLTVSGKVLEPIVRDVTIKRLPELPNIRAICYFQERRHRIHVEWPEGVSEISLSAPGKRTFEYTKDQFSKESVFLPYDDSVRPVEIQAIRRFGQKKTVFGPKAQVAFIDSRRTLLVSIERAPKSALASLRFWEKVSWGMKVRLDDHTSLPAINVTVENPGKSMRMFVIPVGSIKPDVFFPFPSDWGVCHGATIDVSITDGCGRAYVKYLTSQVVS